MRKIIFLLFLMIGAVINVQAQTETDRVVKAFKTGSAELIAEHFDEFVDLKLLDKDEVKNMSKNQAEQALKSFYAEKEIKGFDKVSEGGKGNLLYILGKLTNGNKVYSITIQLKQKAGNLHIITMRIS
ncbi:MAG: DUF4783 domain-containing protein [Sphingobacteriia bacterium]|nr:MAG: DUF4783 domain-containing protein [Sphingobacteriia bacterium]TAG31510.1 MAG: DUF4783 domain-containing protein [Sphingobacteriia bacterium]